MIPRKNNIPTKYFPAVLKGQSFFGSYFRVVVSGVISDQKPHIAVVVAKKYGKLATERNLFRRSISAEIMKYIDLLPYKTIVFLVQKPISYEKTVIRRKQAAVNLTKDAQELIKQIIKKYEKTR